MKPLHFSFEATNGKQLDNVRITLLEDGPIVSNSSNSSLQMMEQGVTRSLESNQLNYPNPEETNSKPMTKMHAKLSSIVPNLEDEFLVFKPRKEQTPVLESILEYSSCQFSRSWARGDGMSPIELFFIS